MRSSPSENYRILIAEDNPADVRLIREALRTHQVPCDLDVVNDGAKALQLMRDFGANAAIRPDLILLDLNLPKSDGREILKRIRETPELGGIPVIVLSSSTSPFDRAEMERLGVSQFVSKPLSLDEFMEIGALAKQLVGAV